MPAKRLCIICREKPAEVPDRNQMGRPIKRVCRECHAARLRGDLKRIMDARERAKRNADAGD
jgi:hypothetical protein